MTSNHSPVHPPRVTSWLVELFASPQEADGILGDLAEEFDATMARDGAERARRVYRRLALRTVRDLIIFPLRTGQRLSGAVPTAGLGLVGFLWPIDMVMNAVVRRIMPDAVYDYARNSLFWSSIDLSAWLMSGVFVALLAHRMRLRSMNAALAMVAIVAVVLAADRPLMMWLYGPPLSAHVTIASSVVRLVRGVATFGGAVLVGAAIGRKAFRGPQHRLYKLNRFV